MVKDIPIDIPKVPFMDYIFEDFDRKIATYKNRPWIVDIPSGRSVTFGQVKRDATKIASALARKGFKQGDVLYFVTYELAHLYLVSVGVWLLGGVVRGCYQAEAPELYASQIKESRVRFALIDKDTISVIKTALQDVDSKVELLSLGSEPLKGTTHISELLKDDGKAFVKPKMLDTKSERLVILNTSGSTGYPKGVVHTHYSAVACIQIIGNARMESPALEFMINFGIGVFALSMYYLRHGHTLYHVNKFDKEQLFNQIMTHKPKWLVMYPFVANWFSRCDDELKLLKAANFLKLINLGGWVLDATTANLLAEKLPNTCLQQMYGMTEICMASGCVTTDSAKKLKTCSSEGQVFTSSGKIYPCMEAKILDISSGKIVKTTAVGELYIRAPCNSLGYLTAENEIDSSNIVDGWLQTGDVAFMDDEGHLYIKDRAKFVYVYKAAIVLPSEIESVLLEHPDVQASGVAGIRNFETDYISKAFVVLKPGRKCSEQEICDFVASKMPEHKQLHGGVRFVDKLPENKGGKLDRKTLFEMATKDVSIIQQ